MNDDFKNQPSQMYHSISRICIQSEKQQRSKRVSSFHECPECTYRTKKLSHLRGHLIVHKSADERRQIMEKLPTYECKNCEFKTKYRSNLIVHKKQHEFQVILDPKEKLKCEFDMKTKTWKSRKRNETDAYQLQTFECKVCKSTMENRSSFQRHMLVHLPEDHHGETDKNISIEPVDQYVIDKSQDTKILNCRHCSFATKYRSSYKYHSATHLSPKEREKLHKGVPSFQCSICRYKTNTKNDYNRHLVVHLTEEEHLEMKKNLPIHKCAECDYVTNFRTNFRRHYFEMHKAPEQRPQIYKSARFKCYQCSFETSYRSVIKKHVIRHQSLEEKQRHYEQMPTFECVVCEYKSKNKYSYKRHLLVHLPEEDRKEIRKNLPTFKCEHCKFVTVYKNNFSKHLNTTKHQENIKK